MKKLISIAQKGLILNETRKKILISKYTQSKYLPKRLVNKLCLPGGQIDFGENPNKSFIREVKEETGITITPSLPFHVWCWTYLKNNSKKQIVAVARLAFYKSGRITKPKGETETKIDKAKWVSLEEVNIKKFVVDEQPVIKRFLEYSKSNPFKPPLNPYT